MRVTIDGIKCDASISDGHVVAVRMVDTGAFFHDHVCREDVFQINLAIEKLHYGHDIKHAKSGQWVVERGWV